MMTRLFVALAVVCLASAVVWHLTLGQSLTQRIPPGWSWSSQYVGEVTYPDRHSGQFPVRNELGAYRRALTILSEDRHGSVLLNDAYKITNLRTGVTEWEYIIDFEIDPDTGQHLNPEYSGQYIVLPQDLRKDRTYTLRSSYIKGMPLQFVREEVIEGVQVFLFAYEGRGEYTEAYTGTAEYAGVEVPPGHEIKCAQDQFRLLVWAEVVTGEVLKIKESCLSGDYIFDIATGRAVEPVLRWEAETAGMDVVRQADAVRDRITQLRLARYLPVVLAGLGLVLAMAGIVRMGPRRA